MPNSCAGTAADPADPGPDSRAEAAVQALSTANPRNPLQNSVIEGGRNSLWGTILEQKSECTYKA